MVIIIITITLKKQQQRQQQQGHGVREDILSPLKLENFNNNKIKNISVGPGGFHSLGCYCYCFFITAVVIIIIIIPIAVKIITTSPENQLQFHI